MNRRWLTRCVLSIIFCGLCWFFPLFHVRPINSKAAEAGSTSLSTASKNGTAKSLKDYTGTSVTQFWDACQADFAQAQKRYGRQAGLGGPWYFCLQGQGTVQSVDKNQAVIKIDGTQREVRMALSLLVDNTVREAIGVKASEFANSQDFNAFAAELNRQVDREVLAPNRDLLSHPGTVVKFVGCARIANKSDLDPLALIPINVEIMQSGGTPQGSPDAVSGAPAR